MFQNFTTPVLWILAASLATSCSGFSVPGAQLGATNVSSVGVGRIATGTLNLGQSSLSATNLFSDMTALTPNSGLVEYGVNVPLWTDGATKRRWLAVPDSSQITFNASSPWKFPVGSVFVKNFSMTMADGTSKKIETRVLVAGSSAWTGYSYQWNDAGTDATLLTGATTASLQIADPNNPGATLAYTYNFPVGQCTVCHNQTAGYALGVNTPNLNGAFTPGPDSKAPASSNQLTSLSQAGLFASSIPDTTTLASFPVWKDPNASAQDEARAYLSVNCAHCHQPGGPSGQNFDLRSTTVLPNANIMDVAPAIALGLPNEARIRSGSNTSSDIWMRMSNTDTSHMPLLGSSVPEQAALTIIANWINSL